MLVAMSGNDTVQIDNHNFADFADDTPVEIKFSNEIATAKTGKGGNTIYGLNESGRQAELTIRVIRGGADDKFLLSRLASQQQNFAGFTLMQGQFTKKIGDGAGNIASDTYILGGGVFSKLPEAKMNVAGDATQSMVLWTIKFSNAPRAIA